MRYNQEFRFGASGLGNMAVKTSPATNAGGRICGDALDCRFDYGYYSASPSTLPPRKPRLPARALCRLDIIQKAANYLKSECDKYIENLINEATISGRATASISFSGYIKGVKVIGIINVGIGARGNGF